MQDTLSQELKRLLSNGDITTLFQPIVDIEEKIVFGYEALSRGPSDSPLHSAQILFETAERCGLAMDLEVLCLRSAARNWSGQGAPQRLFVNISPAKLMPAEFEADRLQALIRQHRLSPSDIVIELSERYPTADPAELCKTLAWLKAQGFRIAIDDLGSGYSGLKLWSELKPDFVKIDRHFIRDIQDDLVKREFLRSVVELADRIGCTLIAEGIETCAEFQVVSGLGISLVQGFLFGRPKQIATACLDVLGGHEPATAPLSSRQTAGALGSYIQPLSPEDTLQTAWERLQNEPGTYALPVVEDGVPVGLIHKWRVLETFSTPYGRALYEKQPVTHMLSTDALMVSHDMPLEDVSQRLIDEDVHYLKQHFIIVRDGQYMGLGATRSLLQQITAQKIEKARYANPLTLLPGNVPIQQSLAARVRTGAAFALLYFDINHFKPLNDALGYRVGDQVILMLADVLSEIFRAGNDFIGHIGGDDFVVVTESPNATDLARRAQQQFTQRTRRFYRNDDLRRGSVETEGRDGQLTRFPLVSLAVGIITVKHQDPRTPDQISDAASRAKKQAKSAPDGLAIDTGRQRENAPWPDRNPAGSAQIPALVQSAGC